MPATHPGDRVTLHLKVERSVRDQLLGKLRAQGMTMQYFFETLMHGLIADEKALDEAQEFRRRYASPRTYSHS
jgi:hypothetical protein